MSRLVADLPWTEIRSRLDTGAVAVLPIGAAAKEHGPHLPMQTDYLQAGRLAAELAEREDVLVWPTVGYGYYPAFVRFAGSTSLSRETFRDVIAALLKALEDAGASRILVLNTGLSTIGPIREALAGKRRAKVGLANVYRGPLYERRLAEVCSQTEGSHADEAETSIMLHFFPAKVRLEEAVRWTRKPPHVPWEPDDAGDPSYCPDGVYGDPTLATREKGAALVAAMLDDLRRSLREL
ncbi:MAG: creatininase family protein [Myxococcota bacterium]